MAPIDPALIAPGPAPPSTLGISATPVGLDPPEELYQNRPVAMSRGPHRADGLTTNNKEN